MTHYEAPDGTVYRISTEPDEDAASPREDNDGNLATIVCWHRRTNLGDETIRTDDYDSMEELVASFGETSAILPVYLYEHSGMTVRTTPFGDPWDSGQVGWMFTTKARQEELGCTGDDWTREHLEESLRGELATYDLWLRGGFVGYVVERREPWTKTYADGRVESGFDWTDVDSCWGFDDEDYAMEEARACLPEGSVEIEGSA